METNFTVIQFQRQHFGNQPGSFNDIEPDVPFVGPAKDFVFDCPKVNPNDTALLLFQSRDVSHARNVFRVNGVQLFGGLPVSPSRDTWNGNVLLVERHHGLRETGNVLRVESRNTGGGADGDVDDFLIDNVVIQYKTLEPSAHGIFNVRSYGARGDGSQSDFGAILAARDALNAAGGGVLFFPPGTYILYHPIELGANTTVLGAGPGSVLLAKPKDPGGQAFNMLFMGDVDNVRVRDLVLDGNSGEFEDPDEDGDDEEDEEDIGCGFLGMPVRKGQTGLFITNVIVRNHHRAGIRIIGPRPGTDDVPKPNEVEVIGCRIVGCGSRGILLTRSTCARIAGNTIISCTQAGIQLVRSRTAVIDGNVIRNTVQRKGTTGGNGIAVASSFDYVIVNNAAIENGRWGIVASGGVGLPPDEAMSQYFVVQNNICRANAVGGITIDPSTRDDDDEATGVIHDSFATVASNVCVGNHGRGIQTVHAGYVAVHGNICDSNDHTSDTGNDSSDGIGILSSRCALVANNVLTANRHGVAFFGDPTTVPKDTPDMGHHLLGSNMYDRNRAAEPIEIGDQHPPIRQLHDQPPGIEWGGVNLPVKPTPGDPANGVDGALYLNIDDRQLRVYAEEAWRTLQTTTGTSW